MSLPKPGFFISATRADLAPTREIVRAALLDIGATPLGQEHSAPSGQSVSARLRETIASCHAVIHLVGECSGAEDENAPAAHEHRTYAGGRRSYTQLEFDLARELRRPCHVFVCGEDFPFLTHEPESAEMQRLQADHRAQVLGGSVVVQTIRHSDELREHILQLKNRLPERAAAQASSRPKSPALIAALVLVPLLLLATGAWWFAQPPSQTKTVTDASLTDHPLTPAREPNSGTPSPPTAVATAVPTAPGVPAPVSTSEFDAQYKLADNYFQQKKFTAAAAAWKELLPVLQEKRPVNDRLTLAVMHGLGSALRELHDYGAAENMLRRALEGREKTLGPDDADTLATMAELANVLMAKGDYVGAESILRKVVPSSEGVLGAMHVDTVGRINILAIVLNRRGKVAESETLLRRAMATAAQEAGPFNVNTLTTVNNLAITLYAKGDLAGAEQFMRQALAGREKALGPEHPSTIKSMSDLAGILLKRDNLAEAAPLFRRSFELSERVMGPDDPDTIQVLSNYSVFLSRQKDYAAAEPLYRRVLAAKEKLFGTGHPETLTALNNLAVVLRDQHNFAAAEPLFQRYIEASTRMLGATHPETLTATAHYAELLQGKGDMASAERLYRSTLAGREQTLGENHPDTCMSTYSLANLLGILAQKNGNKDEARRLAVRAYHGFLQANGPDYLWTQQSRRLAVILGVNPD